MLRGGAAGRRYTVRLGDRGRIELPADVRQALRVQAGDEVILTIEPAGTIHVTSRAAVARRCLGMLAPPPDRQLVAELVAERREEAACR
jgi:AbrB family looped-hinge helix DNA binding protein